MKQYAKGAILAFELDLGAGSIARRCAQRAMSADQRIPIGKTQGGASVSNAEGTFIHTTRRGDFVRGAVTAHSVALCVSQSKEERSGRRLSGRARNAARSLLADRGAFVGTHARVSSTVAPTPAPASIVTRCLWQRRQPRANTAPIHASSKMAERRGRDWRLRRPS